MKRFFIVYLVFTVLWPVSLAIFNEETIPIPVFIRVVMMYVWLGFLVLSCILMIVYTLKRQSPKQINYVLALLVANVLIMFTNPFQIITGFLG